MKVLLYACEQNFGGMHGIEDYCVSEYSDGTDLDKIYREDIIPMSFEVMDSYSFIMEDIYEEALEWADEGTDEYYDVVDELMHQNVSGFVRVITNDDGKSTTELDGELSDLGVECFMERYVR